MSTIAQNAGGVMPTVPRKPATAGRPISDVERALIAFISASLPTGMVQAHCRSQVPSPRDVAARRPARVMRARLTWGARAAARREVEALREELKKQVAMR